MWGITGNGGAAHYATRTAADDKRNTRKRRAKHAATMSPELQAIMKAFSCGAVEAQRILRQARRELKD